MSTDTYDLSVKAELDYAFDFAKWLAPMSDTVASYTIRVDPGLVLLDSELQGAKVAVKIKVGTGKIGATLNVICKITTVGGSMGPRVDERSMHFTIVQR